jgi:hypothetical protein
LSATARLKIRRLQELKTCNNRTLERVTNISDLSSRTLPDSKTLSCDALDSATFAD